jgi:putative membrane protein
LGRTAVPIFFVGPLLFVAALVSVALYVRSRRPSGPTRIVAERYARGDIDEDEYRRRLTELRAR